MRYRLLIMIFVGLVLPLICIAESTNAYISENVISWHLHHIPDSAQTNIFLSNLSENGTWDDIDYSVIQRGNWPLMHHLERLLDLSIAFKSEKHIIPKDKKTKQKILSAYNHFTSNNYQNSNWWHNVIGIQKDLGPIIILIKDLLSDQQLEHGMIILRRSSIGMTGQNKVWLSGNVIYRATLENDTALLRKASEAIQEEIQITSGEGIQADFSFHQHGPQQQFGNYGLHFARELVYWASVLNKTPYQLKENEIDILRQFLFDGLRWVSFYDQFDISACGRQLFPNEQTLKNIKYTSVLEDFVLIDEKSKLRSSVSQGSRYFWNSDYLLHRPDQFAASVKMSSDRVKGSEAGNGENLLGYHLGDGATYIYRNGEEYKNIFPLWDWKKIPGTTSRQDTAALPILSWDGYHNNSSFVGGCSNGQRSIASMEYKRDSLNGFKSWFLFNDAVVCVGSGIQTNDTVSVVTTVNQSYLADEVIVADNEYIRSLGRGEHFFENLQWAIHDSIGYYFFYNQQVVIENIRKQGNWKKVVNYQSDKTIEGDIFTMTVEHGENPKNGNYAYCIVPGVDRSMMESYFRYQLLENNRQVHAIKDSRKDNYGIVFFEEGGLMLSANIGLGVNHPAIVMLEDNGKGLTINLSEPSQQQDSLELTIIGNYESPDLRYENDFDNGETTLFIDLPDSIFAGSTVEILLNLYTAPAE